MRTKRIIISLMTILVLSGAALAVAAESEKDKETKESKETTPVAAVSINVTRVGVGVGVSWGDGALKYQGKEYKFKVSGLNLISLGVSSVNATGDVYNLKKLSDFPGKYFGVEGGATLIKGSSGLVIRNNAGVVIDLKTAQKGMDLRLGNEGLSISPAWE